MALQISKKHKKKDKNPHLLWFVHNINTHRSNILQLYESKSFKNDERIPLAGTRCRPRVVHQLNLNCWTWSLPSLTILPYCCLEGELYRGIADFENFSQKESLSTCQFLVPTWKSGRITSIEFEWTLFLDIRWLLMWNKWQFFKTSLYTQPIPIQLLIKSLSQVFCPAPFTQFHPRCIFKSESGDIVCKKSLSCWIFCLHVNGQMSTKWANCISRFAGTPHTLSFNTSQGHFDPLDQGETFI